jgi:two-component system, cell cycle sensor histidine kinase and response regulator CckA
MKRPLDVLMVEDSPEDAEIILYDMRNHGIVFTCRQMASVAEFARILPEREPELILSDYHLPDGTALDTLRLTRERFPHAPYIVVTGSINEEVAVACMKAGADDYVLKDHIGRLGPVISTALRNAELRREKAAAYEALRQSEEKYRRIINTAREGIWIADNQFNTTFVNARMGEILGYSPEEMVGRPVCSFIPEEDLENFELHIDQQRQGNGGNYEHRFVRRDKRIVWALVSVSVQPDEKGAFNGAVSMITDISALKQKEEELRFNHEELRQKADFQRQFMDALPVPVFVKNTKGQYMDCNNAYERFFSIKNADLIGKSASDFTSADLAEESRRYDIELWKHPGVQCYESDVKDSRGDLHRVVFHKATFQNDAGEVIGLIGAILDISERVRAEEALRESERRFATIFHANPAAIAMTRIEDDRLTDVNGAWEKITGYSRTEALEHTSFELNLWTEPERRKLMVEMLQEQGHDSVEVQLRQKSGQLCDVLMSAETIEVGDKKFLLTMGQDIGERKRAELELQRSKAQLETAVRASNTGLWDWNLTNDKVFYSREWKSQIGYAEDEIGDGHVEWTKRLHPDDKARVEQTVNDYLQGRRPTYEVEFRFRHRDGSWRWIFARGALQPDASGRPVRLLGSHIDITELKRTEEQLRLLNTVVEEMSEGLLITDNGGTIQYVNQAFIKITGYSTAEAIGQTPRILKSGYQVKRFYNDLWADILSGKPWAGELINKRKDGSYYPQRTAISPVFSVDGNCHFVSVFQDASHEKKLEEQLLQAVKMESLGRLAGGIAHDFNNLLTVVNGYGEMLVHKVADEDLKADLREIVNAGEKAARLTAQILAFSRQQEFHLEQLNVNDLLREMGRMLDRVLGDETKLLLNLAADLSDIRCDRSQLEQVVMNLVVNARDAMAHSGRLTIQTFAFHMDEEFVSYNRGARPGNYICMAVTDTGGGIDPVVRDRIFEPFFTTKKVGEGTGLGLATVYGIVKQHNGYIRVESEIGVGTTFFVYFPIGMPTTTNAESVSVDESAVWRWSGLRALLVEDQDEVRRIAQRILEKAGFEVEAFADPIDGLRSGQANRYDLLVSDLAMDGMSGDLLASRLREYVPELAVLLTSGYPERFDTIRLTRDQRLQFVKKPFKETEFLNAVASLLPPDVADNDHG